MGKGQRKAEEAKGIVMAKIAVLIDDMYEDVEYEEPKKSFIENLHELDHIGFKKKDVKGKNKESVVQIDRTLDEADPADYNALFIPGGYSPDRLRADNRAVDFVKHFAQEKKPIFMICHAAQLLITADVLKGRKVTGYRSIIQDIKNAGAQFVDAPVVVDKNLVSSRNPDDLEDFTEAVIKKLGEI